MKQTNPRDPQDKREALTRPVIPNTMKDGVRAFSESDIYKHSAHVTGLPDQRTSTLNNTRQGNLSHCPMLFRQEAQAALSAQKEL